VTFLYIGAIAMTAVLLVFLSGLFITIRERRLADAKLKELTQRIFDTQEEERGRVARELHDGISQILIGARYAFELARRRFGNEDPKAPDSLEKGINILGGAIGEVRRISRDLRPGVLDDLGLGPALKALTEEFETRTGIIVHLKTVVFRNRLSEDAKIAMFRIAQEALTNIERHADANEVSISLGGHRNGATLCISDNGRGFEVDKKGKPGSGIGLRNMAERVEHLGGSFRVTSSEITGTTTIDVGVPLKHILPAKKSDSPAPQQGHL
jgi:two-component system NarL family sensor kinase